jgi:hypothetical protein
MKVLASIYFAALTLLWAGCSSSGKALPATAPPANSQQVPAYGNLYYWAAHPWKYDLSDSTPKPYRGFQPDSTVDVFFLHPTTYTQATAVEGQPYETRFWNADINNAELNDRTDRSTMLNQASAFNKYRVFAPRYRQAHIRAFALPDSISRPFFDTAYADILVAFQYYLEHYNQGRPFIIASHSQGTLHAGRLIREQIEGKLIQNRMVAAYIPGLPVPVDYFAQCQPCNNPHQTGCFVTWRTFKKGYTPERVKNEKFKSVVVNPVSWTMDSSFVSRKMQKAAVLYQFNKPKPRNVSTQINGNVLWSSKPRFLGSIFFTRKNYHIGDINLFWKDIRDNVDQRVGAFWKK